jgi:hypothetical protein
LLELAQPLGEHVGAELLQPGAEVGEALRPEHELADDEQRPALAHYIERAGDAARVAIGAPDGHRQ